MPGKAAVFERRRLRPEEIDSPSTVRPKNPVMIMSGSTSGTVCAMKWPDVMPAYRRCPNTPVVRRDISRCTAPPGRNRSEMTMPLARVPSTDTDADDGENGPASASERLVATNAGKRGSIGVSNSPFTPALPAGTGATPSADGVSTAGISRTRGSRQGTRDHPVAQRDPAAAGEREVRDALRGGPRRHQAPLVAQAGGVQASGGSRPTARRPARRGALAIGLPSAAAIARNVVWPSAATSTVPAASPASSTARTMTRCTSCGCTTWIGRSIVSAVAVMTGPVNSRTSASSASRPTISADRTVIASPADGATATDDATTIRRSDRGVRSTAVSDPQYTTASAPAHRGLASIGGHEID